MFDRRALHLARLGMLVLVLLSAALLYRQSARAEGLSTLAVSPLWTGQIPGTLAQDSAATALPGQDFIAAVSQAMDLENQPVPVVQRTIDLLKRIQRGSMYDRNGRLLAVDRQGVDGAWERFYSEPSLAHAIGYVSGLRIGVTGLENSYNAVLFGLDRRDAQIDQLLHRPIKGSDLLLTIDTPVQRAADNALRGQRGAIVVLDEKTGAVLAMASSPRFDPNRINDDGYLNSLLAGCDGATDCPAELINRAAQSTFPPGSTWKTVTLIAALDTGQVQPGTLFDFGEPVQGPNGPYYVYTVNGGTIADVTYTEDQLDLEMAYALSSNAAFAEIGDQMPADSLLHYARRLGFGQPGEVTFPLEIEYTPSQIAHDTGRLYSDDFLRAETGAGHGELLASPLNIAMMVLPVVNEGNMPLPYLVETIQEPSGRSVKPANRTSIDHIMQPETAMTVRQMMINAVQRGTGQKAAVPGLLVGGKTGTAPTGVGQATDAWFTGFAEYGGEGVVIAVLIENGGEGPQVAAPIFAEIAQVALRDAIETAPLPTATPPPVQTAPPASETTLQPTDVPTPEPTFTPTATPVPTTTLPAGYANVPTPEITRDPFKTDITAENPSCGVNMEVPEGTGMFIWPSQYQALSGGNFREGHPGLDLNAPPGSPVYAADTGLVIFAGWSGSGYGNTILIDHGNGFRTLYAHLSQVSTYCGAKVQKGKIIGLSGNTGNSTGPHLHFEVRVPGGYINPVDVLPVP